MKKQSTLVLLVLLMAGTAQAQKPKATYDHAVFARKVVQAGPDYIPTWQPAYKDIQYISKATGKTVSELNTKHSDDRSTLIDDCDYLKKYRIGGVVDSVGLTIIQETPVKIADIVIHYNRNGKPYTITLTNCIQTNTNWVLGDHVVPKGEAISDFTGAAQARDDKMTNTFLGKVNAVVKKADSTGKAQEAESSALKKTIKGYQAVLFGQQGPDNAEPYINFTQIGMPLKGYYITNKDEKIDAVICYVEPEKLLLQPFDLFICKEANNKKVDALNPNLEPNFLKFVHKSDIKAFFVGGQLFIQYQREKWGILIGEGAIRKLVRIENVKMLGSNHTVVRMLQKLSDNPEGQLSIDLSFEKRMSEFVKENPDLASKIASHAPGYHSFDQDKIIIEFNKWFDKQYPYAAEYLPLDIQDPADDPTELVTLGSKEELTAYLKDKVWEVATFSMVAPNIMSMKIEGRERLKAAHYYAVYEMAGNGALYINGTKLAWSVKDEKTCILSGTPCQVEGVKANSFRIIRTNGESGNQEKLTIRLVRPLKPGER